MLKIAYHPLYHHPLPPGHRFPMEKYSLLPEQLIYEGTCVDENFFVPTPLTKEKILKTHCPDYFHKLKTQSLSRQEERKTGFPLTQQLFEREVMIVGGTVENTNFAIEHGVSMNIAGGTHHAFYDRGEGFCLLNDIALGAHHLLEKHPDWKILVVDLDVHQGNGTASLFENDPRVFTFSMHGGNNYPLHKEKSDVDVELPDGIEDREYLKLLDFHLKRILDWVQPQFVFFQSGVDIISTDKLGRLGVSLNGCKKRDQLVLSLCKENNIPVAISMGGGYSPNIKDIIEAHANTYRQVQEIYF